MGYSFIGYHRATDDESLFYAECMYAYEPVFKQCFGKEISKFSGRVTKRKIEEFKIGLEKFKSNQNNNRDSSQFVRRLSNTTFVIDLSNTTYEKLCEELLELLKLMESKEVCYLHIG